MIFTIFSLPNIWFFQSASRLLSSKLWITLPFRLQRFIRDSFVLHLRQWPLRCFFKPYQYFTSCRLTKGRWCMLWNTRLEICKIYINAKHTLCRIILYWNRISIQQILFILYPLFRQKLPSRRIFVWFRIIQVIQMKITIIFQWKKSSIFSLFY